MFNETLEKIKIWYRGLPDKKKYVEFITAVLTVPVLLTVLISNLSNINNSKRNDLTPTPEPTKMVATITEKVDQNGVSITPTTPVSPTPTANPECKKEVGPVRISSPIEGQLINSSPVCIQISYQVGEYCSVVWSYRVDEGDWSDYTDKAICLYDLPIGPKTLELRVKSSQSDDEVTLVRNFYFKSKQLPTPTPTITVAPTPQ